MAPKKQAARKKRAAGKRVSRNAYETQDCSPLELERDPYNPRLTKAEEGSDQETLIRIMIERFKVAELGRSIATSGYLPFDPIVGWRDRGKVTVLEGNRRTAALKLLLNPDLAPQAHRRTWRDLRGHLTPSRLETLNPIKVFVFGDRTEADVAAYIGFRHVTSVLKWPALEKAQYIVDLVDKHGWSYERVAECLGSYPSHVEKHYVAYKLVDQATASKLPGAENMQTAFGVLLRALQAGGIAAYLGVKYPGDPKKSRAPVPKARAENLKGFVEWTFGTSEKAPVLTDSRQLTKWGRILQSSQAIRYLKTTSQPSFDRAWFKSGGESESLADSLHAAADRLEESVALAAEHSDEQDVQDAVGRCARFLSQMLREHPEIASRYGFRPKK